MKTRFLCILIAFSIVIFAFASCSEQRNALSLSSSNAMNLENEDSLQDDASREQADATDTAFSFDSVGASEGLYRYVYSEEKEFYENVFNAVLSAEGATAEDTEKFWLTVIPDSIYAQLLQYRANFGYDFKLAEADCGSSTYADFLVDHVNGLLRTYLAYSALADEYGYDPKSDYDESETSLNQAIAFEILDAKIVDDADSVDEILDKDTGKINDWVLNRWKVYLAGKGITHEEWVSLYYDLPIIMSNLPAHIYSSNSENEESLDSDDVEVLFKEYLDEFEEETVGFKFVLFDYLTEESYNKVLENKSEETTEESEGQETSDVSSEVLETEVSEELEASDEALESFEHELSDTVSEESEDKEPTTEEPDSKFSAFDTKQVIYDSKNYDDYIKSTTDYCNDVFGAIEAGDIKFEDAYALSPYGSMILYQSNGMDRWPNDEFEKLFGKKSDSVVMGERDIFFDTENQFVWFMEYVALDVDDYSYEVKENTVNQYNDALQQEEVNKLLKDVLSMVTVEDSVISEYKQPWKVD